MGKQREELIRRIFEAEREIAWAENVEGKARTLGADDRAMKELREAFDRHMENRDWAWWQRRAQRKYSTAELADLLEETIERANALAIKTLQQEQERERGGGMGGW